ncbi:tetratricopeptide repeat protein 34 [Candoia aspera]|uniref:tetratricopeptide repeat protein 34 n=1 Tax=Candoia aspera TaxID=51853 RepID=UPI002FD82928
MFPPSCLPPQPCEVGQLRTARVLQPSGDAKNKRDFCQEGDRQLTNGEFPPATAFYVAGFLHCAPLAVKKVAALDKGFQAKVVAILERWCQGESPIPKIEPHHFDPPSLNVATAAALLSAFDPHNAAALPFRMEALLQEGHHHTVASQCESLLGAHRCVELVLTHALALVLSPTRSRDGVAEYLRTFAAGRNETVTFVSCQQRRYLEKIIWACLDCLSLWDKGDKEPLGWKDLCCDFLATIAPEDIRVCQIQATRLLERHRYEDCVSVSSRALEVFPPSGSPGDEETSSLLMHRAAAFFAIGGHMPEMLRDLVTAFEASPRLARTRFEALFSPGEAERVEKHARATLEGDFAAYREAVRVRAEVRSNDGRELLAPVLRVLRFLVQISPGALRELNVHLANCYLLEGNFRASLEVCNCLLDSAETTYRNTLLAQRGFCHLHANCCPEALRDFQAVVEDGTPHPSSCVKALCGRGLIRAWGGDPYLTALDYLTACRLRFEETGFVIKAYVPWNQRGFLLVSLQEQVQKMLERKERLSSGARLEKSGRPGGPQKEGDAFGIHQLASLLLQLDSSDEVSRLLCADALYQMGRLEEARKSLLVALSKGSEESPILARLALLQLKKGCVYDCNQHLKKMIQAGEMSCLQGYVKVLKEDDRVLLKTHCHTRAVAVLQNKQGEAYLKEAIAYLSLAITAAGDNAVDSLLVRARCYGLLGQKKTAIFDFKAILKEDPRNTQALCGKGFVHLALDQKKESTQDLIAALQGDPASALAEIRSLKPDAQVRIRSWLLEHCRAVLKDFGSSQDPSETLEEASQVGELLVEMDNKDSEAHILCVDLLIARGRAEAALSYLQRTFGQSEPNDAVNSRLGILQAMLGNLNAVHVLASLAAKGCQKLEHLMGFLDASQRINLAQVAAREARAMMEEQCRVAAVKYLTLAILASNSNPQYLRQRAACWAHLEDYRNALEDIQKVVQKHGTNSVKTQVGDFCSWAYMLLSVSDDELAVKQYINALQLEKSLALSHILTDRRRDELSKAFLRTAQSYFAADRYEEAWTTAKFGLLVDQKNPELKKLKARIKRQASGCKVQ